MLTQKKKWEIAKEELEYSIMSIKEKVKRNIRDINDMHWFYFFFDIFVGSVSIFALIVVVFLI